MNRPKGNHGTRIKQMLNPWWRYVFGMDNKAIFNKVKCPVLAIYFDMSLR
jgi:hypothetical protein